MEIYEFTEPSWSILPILSASTITPIGKSREMVREKKRRKKISFRDSENKSSVIRPGARGPESPAPNPQTIDQEWRQISPENCVPRSAVAGFSWSDFYYSRSLIGTFCIHHTNLQRILPVCRIWDKFVIFDIDFWRDHWGADSLPASIDSTGLLSSLFKPFFFFWEHTLVRCWDILVVYSFIYTRPSSVCPAGGFPWNLGTQLGRQDSG